MRRVLFGILGLALAAQASADVTTSVRLEYFPDARIPTRYLLSFPAGGAFEDIANHDNGFPDHPCDTSVSGTDGVIDSDDALCSLWGGGDPAGRVGRMTLSRYDSTDCAWLSRTAVHTPLGVVFAGMSFELDGDAGYLLELGPSGDDPPHDATVTLQGACRPEFRGVTVGGLSCTPSGQLALLHVPYLTTLRTSIELLCGEEGVDWVDADLDWLPDTCPGGLYDGVHAVRVETWINDDQLGPGPADGFVGWVGTSVRPWPGHGDVFPDGSGGYDLAPGQAYVLRFEASYTEEWDPPVDPCPLTRPSERLPLP